jgi:hypothetical protein
MLQMHDVLINPLTLYYFNLLILFYLYYWDMFYFSGNWDENKSERERGELMDIEWDIMKMHNIFFYYISLKKLTTLNSIEK